ncbi:hypothetical protein F6U93_03940 [Tamlana haliotis]|uniref:Uncharacterized protein n=1 Tax=Pseudotamlana haliotis TaxID=2614804 RepID=A0A6N6MES1_9FLAO|nr:hypothetical protein [Tamlana haliotis]KAB1069295.1 hypothetical protein F6U93_03940 [Tamlana haliotis]
MKLLIIFLLLTIKIFSQTESNTCFEKLKTNINNNKAELIGKKIDYIFRVLNCDIKGIDLTECPPSNFKSNGCGIPAMESMKVKSILLFFNPRESITVEDILKPIEIITKKDSLKNNLIVEIFIKESDNYPYFDKLSEYEISPLEGDNWNNFIMSKLITDNYYVKDIVIK